MKDVLQTIIIVLVFLGAVLLARYKAKKEKEPGYICIIRMVIYISFTLSTGFAFLEFVNSNLPIVEITAKRIGNNEDGAVELVLTNRSKSFGTNVKIKYLLALYEDKESNFVVKRSTGLLKSSNVFLSPTSNDTTFLIETNECVAMRNVFNDINSLNNHHLVLYVFLDQDVPFLPFVRIGSEDLLLYKNSLSKFYTVTDVERYQGAKKIKMEKIFAFLKEDGTKESFNNFMEHLNKEK